MKRMIFLITLFLFIPFSVNAVNTTEKFYMDVTINEDGSINVLELSLLKGNYNGRTRNLKYRYNNSSFDNIFEGNDIYSGSDITNIKVSDIDKNDISFEKMFTRNNYYDLATYGSSGDYAKYTLSEYDGRMDFKIFMPSSYNKASIIEYTIKDVVVLHNDYAEIYFNIFDNSYEENIEDFIVKVHLPGNDSEARYWAHGPLNASVEMIDEKTVVLTSDFIGAYNPVDYRILFDKSLVSITNPSKISGIDSLNQILEVENNRADKANKEREIVKAKVLVIDIISYVWFFGLIAYLVYVYINHDKEKKSTFTNQYHRDFPNDYRPEMVEYLLKKRVTVCGFEANVMSLIQRNNINIKERLTRKDKKDYRLILVNRDNLDDLDEKIITLFFDTIGDGTQVTLEEVSNFGRSSSNAVKFIEGFNSWVSKANINGEEEKLYEKSIKYKIIGVILSLFGILVYILNMGIGRESLIVFLSIPIIFITLFYFILFKKFTDKGSDLYYKWKAFKRFLIDFGRFNEKELPEVILWEKYLVYATALGCAKQVKKSMNIAITKIQNNADSNSNFRKYYITNALLNTSISNSINSAVTTAVRSSSASVSASKSSSGSGFGGGFSSGGGFGGGGGGGGRF